MHHSRNSINTVIRVLHIQLAVYLGDQVINSEFQLKSFQSPQNYHIGFIVVIFGSFPYASLVLMLMSFSLIGIEAGISS